MMRCLKYYWILALLVVGVERVSAFSMLGPFADWMTDVMGYQPPNANIGGPMNLGEEFRWNIPVLYYAVDESFKDYFGQAGIDAVDQAIAILNGLPAMSELSEDLREYPLNTTRMNYRAASLGMADIKTEFLSIILEQLGVDEPDHWVYCIRNHWDPDDARAPQVQVIMRNFDPVSLVPSPYVNGNLYTFTLTHLVPPAPVHVLSITPVLVDPLAYGSSAVADLTHSFRPLGAYFTGLTRDDVGALRYIYKKSNVNVEGVLGTVSSVPLGTVSSGGTGGTDTGGSPWTPIPSTNTTATNATSTNVVVDISTNSLYRPGVDRLRFVKLTPNQYQLMTQFGQAITNVFTSMVITGGITRTFTYQRVINFPDFTFDAADLGDAGFGHITADAWIKNGTTNAGPGIIPAGTVLTLTKVGPGWITPGSYFMSDTNFNRFFIWGSYDGSTNPPIAYPNGTSIQSLEQNRLESDTSNAWQPIP